MELNTPDSGSSFIDGMYADPPIVRRVKPRDAATIEHLLSNDDNCICYALLVELNCDFDNDIPIIPSRIIGIDFTAKSNWRTKGCHTITQLKPSEQAYWLGVADRLVADLHEVEIMRIRDKVRQKVALVGN